MRITTRGLVVLGIIGALALIALVEFTIHATAAMNR
jgi:hypothetical protein